MYRCIYCNESSEASMMSKGGGRHSKTLCKSCHNLRTIARGKRNREKYVAYLGGCCIHCGYSKCLDALDFHHKDPDTKDPAFRSFRYWGLEKAKLELAKCELVCANCHREIHSTPP